MVYMKEITDWGDNEFVVPNHVYILESRRAGARLLGYIKKGTEEKIMFEKPMRFDQRFRKFEEVSL